MRKVVAAAAVLLSISLSGGAQQFEKVPFAYKWLDASRVAFSYDGSFTGAEDFVMETRGYSRKVGISFPEKYVQFPLSPTGAVNLTYSPDSTMLAFTRDNNLWVADIATGSEHQITDDGSELILNGYASWVYYEEILGRPSRYRAFWWSPDSRKIGFYRFDNTQVPMFPIYSPFGQDGRLSRTRYPKAGEPNPKVRIGIADLSSFASDGKATGTGIETPVVWADFDEDEDQYFGIPFWGADSREFFISREPRIQNTLDLYSVSAEDGSKSHIYHETYKTWLDWIEGMIFTRKGLYMVRSFETGWQQIYFLSYDGKTLERLTDGPNWRVSLIRVDEKTGDVFFTARRESSVRTGVYKVDKNKRITPLTDSAFDASRVEFSPDGRHFVCALSNFTTPYQIWLFDTDHAAKAKDKFAGRHACKVADMRGLHFDKSDFALPQLISMTTPDGFTLPGYIVFPRDFDPSRQYPVHVDIYGGPDTPMVQDSWHHPSAASQWWSDNGIIEVTADCRAAGHNGRAGLDCIYRQLDVVEVQDFCRWAEYLKSLPYVDGEKIGVEGFSFGGTMTSLLVMNHSDLFHYGIAGGGVYDWSLYDTHYTERFMETPQSNPDGYSRTRVISQVKSYPAEYSSTASGAASVAPVMLMLTHGTGDDNVHVQNTLQLIDELQKHKKSFEFMIYPDGMHGYRGYQRSHDNAANHAFWLKYLKNR